MTTAEPMPSTYHCQHCQKQVVLAAVEGVGWSWVHVASGRVECSTVSVNGL